ncbi:hypothetical protein HDU96_005813, partial [Phlyctochytrium bullatum]
SESPSPVRSSASPSPTFTSTRSSSPSTYITAPSNLADLARNNPVPTYKPMTRPTDTAVQTSFSSTVTNLFSSVSSNAGFSISNNNLSATIVAGRVPYADGSTQLFSGGTVCAGSQSVVMAVWVGLDGSTISMDTSTTTGSTYGTASGVGKSYYAEYNGGLLITFALPPGACEVWYALDYRVPSQITVGVNVANECLAGQIIPLQSSAGSRPASSAQNSPSPSPASSNSPTATSPTSTRSSTSSAPSASISIMQGNGVRLVVSSGTPSPTSRAGSSSSDSSSSDIPVLAGFEVLAIAAAIGFLVFCAGCLPLWNYTYAMSSARRARSSGTLTREEYMEINTATKEIVPLRTVGATFTLLPIFTTQIAWVCTIFSARAAFLVAIILPSIALLAAIVAVLWCSGKTQHLTKINTILEARPFRCSEYLTLSSLKQNSRRPKPVTASDNAGALPPYKPPDEQPEGPGNFMVATGSTAPQGTLLHNIAQPADPASANASLNRQSYPYPVAPMFHPQQGYAHPMAMPVAVDAFPGQAYGQLPPIYPGSGAGSSMASHSNLSFQSGPSSGAVGSPVVGGSMQSIPRGYVVPAQGHATYSTGTAGSEKSAQAYQPTGVSLFPIAGPSSAGYPTHTVEPVPPSTSSTAGFAYHAVGPAPPRTVSVTGYTRHAVEPTPPSASSTMQAPMPSQVAGPSTDQKSEPRPPEHL